MYNVILTFKYKIDPRQPLKLIKTLNENYILPLGSQPFIDYFTTTLPGVVS